MAINNFLFSFCLVSLFHDTDISEASGHHLVSLFCVHTLLSIEKVVSEINLTFSKGAFSKHIEHGLVYAFYIKYNKGKTKVLKMVQ